MVGISTSSHILLTSLAGPAVDGNADEEDGQAGEHGQAHLQVDLHQADQDLQRTCTAPHPPVGFAPK